jgi:transcription elongation factor GreA
MRNGNVQLTPSGRARLEEELANLRDVRRPETAGQLSVANEDGDGDDSGETEDLKQELITIDHRIEELEFMLAHAEILDHVVGDAVVLGSVVTIKDDAAEEETWTLVDPAEADTRNGSISTDSPVGRVLMGKRVGESATVETPAGQVVYTVTNLA